MKPGFWANRTNFGTGDKPTPVPESAEVLVRIDAVAICATESRGSHPLGLTSEHSGRPHFKKNFTPGHEYMGTIAALDPAREFELGERAQRGIHAGCGQCKRFVVRACTPHA